MCQNSTDRDSYQYRRLAPQPVLLRSAGFSAFADCRWIGSIAAAWRPMLPARISLLAETNSLLLITGNWSRRPWKGSGILALVPAGGSGVGDFPCSFPIDQKTDSRDEFAPDSSHRQFVRVIGDGDVGSSVAPQSPRVDAGFWVWALAKTDWQLQVPGSG